MVFGVPVLLLFLYLALNDGYQPRDTIGLALCVLGCSVLGLASRKYGLEASSVVVWPLQRSLIFLGGSMYLLLLGCEIARGGFNYGDLASNAVAGAVYALWYVWHTKRNFHPEPPPVITG